MNEKLRYRITSFFDYWRERHLFIHNLDFSKYSHEANVLLWASLDALSNLWAKYIGKEQCNKKSDRIIFDAFLARYGGDLFQLVSLPDVWNRIDQGHVYINQKEKLKLPIDQGHVCINQKEKLKLPEDVCGFLNKIGKQPKPTAKEERQTRSISDDWCMDKIIAETLAKYPETNRTNLEEWLRLSRYGAIAYKQMRNAYIHEGRREEGAHSLELHGFEIQPTYWSALYCTPPIIGFKIEFMLRVLGDCICAFQADAFALEKDPVPEELVCWNRFSMSDFE